MKAIFGAEGYRSTVYNDATGKPIVDKSKWIRGATIGYGHKVRSEEWLKYKDAVLTEAQVRKLAEHDLLEARNRLIDYIKVPVSQNVFNALLSRSYNGGIYVFIQRILKMAQILLSSGLILVKNQIPIMNNLEETIRNLTLILVNIVMELRNVGLWRKI